MSDFSNVPSTFPTALSDGQALADDGTLYNSVQTAENNATDYIFIAPGTFNESVKVTTNGLKIMGSGEGTLIDSSTASAVGITVEASNVTVSNLSVTAGDDGINYVLGSDNARVENVTIVDTANTGSGIVLNDDNNIVYNCKVKSADQSGIVTNGNRTVVGGCVVLNNVSSQGIRLNSVKNISTGCIINGVGFQGILGSFGEGENVINGCYIENTGDAGVSSPGDDSIISDNRINNSGAEGILVEGADSLIANNRVSGSTNSNIDTSGATNATTDANVTVSDN